MFFALATAHVITDFVLQPDWMALAKKRSVWVLLLHVGITALGPITLAWLYWPQLWGPAATLAIVHLLADWTKLRLESRFERMVFVQFLIDQVVHVLSIAGVLMAFGLVQWANLTSLVSILASHRDLILRYAFVYSTSIFFGYVLLKILFLSIPTGNPSVVANSHKYVSMLERGLITTFTALGQFLLIAAVIALRLLLKNSSPKDPASQQRLHLEILINIALAMSVGLLL